MGPFVALVFVGWQLWAGSIPDLVVFAIMYVLTGLGITVGFHRLFTHRSFKTSRAMRGVLAALGSAAIEGPAISWVADHRKHHVSSDREGDLDSPHVDHGVGWRGALADSLTRMPAGVTTTHLGSLDRQASGLFHRRRGARRRQRVHRHPIPGRSRAISLAWRSCASATWMSYAPGTARRSGSSGQARPIH